MKGSGTIVTKTFDYKDFDKLMLNDFDGTIKVEAGKPSGTKLFKGGQITNFKKPFYEVTEEAGQIVLIKP